MINCRAFFIEKKWHRTMLNSDEYGRTGKNMYEASLKTYTNTPMNERPNVRTKPTEPRECREWKRCDIYACMYVWTRNKRTSVWWRVNIANIATTLAEANEITGIKNIFLLIMGLAWHIQFGLFHFISFQCFLSFFSFHFFLLSFFAFSLCFARA